MLLSVIAWHNFGRHGARCTGSLGRVLFLFLLAAASATSHTQAQNNGGAPEASAAGGPVITLDEAIRRAQASEPGYAAAVAASKSAGLDKSIAQAGLLPSARFYGQDIYTQPNGI